MLPSPRPGRGWTLAGRAVSPALKLPGCLFSLQPCPLGPGGLVRAQSCGGSSRGGRGQETSQEKAEVAAGDGALATAPGFAPVLLGEGWGERWRTSPVTRPQGWKWHSPSCFWLGEDRVPYSDARKMCSDYGSTLVTITNRSVPRQRWWVCPETSSPRRDVTPQPGFADGPHAGCGGTGCLASQPAASPALAAPPGSSRPTSAASSTAGTGSIFGQHCRTSTRRALSAG